MVSRELLRVEQQVERAAKDVEQVLVQPTGRRVPHEKRRQLLRRECGRLFQVEGCHARHKRGGLTRARKSVVTISSLGKGGGSRNFIARPIIEKSEFT